MGAIGLVIELIISNYFLVSFILSLIVGGFAVARLPKPRVAGAGVERMLAWYCFFAVGVNFLVNFVFHAFFGQMAAEFIGWADSPFQFEVATASLGFAVIGFIAFTWRDFGIRVGAVIAPGIFTLGAAAGHVVQMVTEKNFAAGNAGVVFYTDIIIPVWGFFLLWKYHKDTREVQPADVAQVS